VRHSVLFYDGVCGLCNRMVQFVLRHDRQAVFRFASLQSSLAEQVLERHGIRSADLDSIYVLPHQNGGPADGRQAAGDEPLLARSDAIVFVLRELGGIWRILAEMVKCLPRGLRDRVYRLIARHRYRTFGRYPACPLPNDEMKERFLDL
jgi:predicted DCC family thiol-disulfide oxidoreductase YuxK